MSPLRTKANLRVVGCGDSRNIFKVDHLEAAGASPACLQNGLIFHKQTASDVPDWRLLPEGHTGSSLLSHWKLTCLATYAFWRVPGGFCWQPCHFRPSRRIQTQPPRRRPRQPQQHRHHHLNNKWRAYCLASRTMASVSSASSSRIFGVRRCVARGCPTTEHARRSETGICERT